MAVLDYLEPKRVFSFFEQLCAIPHGSRNNTQMSNFLAEFARSRGLEYMQDAAENVVIIKEASPGYEQAEPVILQGHMDMVCEKDPDCTKDMATEGLDLVVDGDRIFARGTTLGGDDGIAVAMALALLDADDIPHPRLEVIITTDEEMGMEGAFAVDVSALRARRMLNLDSEDEGVFTVSCAGGVRTRLRVPYVREEFAGTALSITIDGLLGGHSGAEIHKGRANADILMGRLLYAARKAVALRLVSVEGGLKDNAIPTASRAVVVTENADVLRGVCEEMQEIFRSEYSVTDGGIQITVADSVATMAMDEASTARVVAMLVCGPDGVQVMSADIPGLVQTSLNLGVVYTDETAVVGKFAIRSSVESQKRMLADRVTCLGELLGAEIDTAGDYPGWAYRQDSPLRDLMRETYLDLYGKEPRIEAIHAGLECGLFAGKIPGLDCVSFGPDLKDIHTPRETMFIGSVQRTWQLLLEILRRMK